MYSRLLYACIEERGLTWRHGDVYARYRKETELIFQSMYNIARPILIPVFRIIFRLIFAGASVIPKGGLEMGNFKNYSYDQTVSLPINFTQQILPGTFEYTFHNLIEKKVDLSLFYERVNNDETGAPAYDPAILLKIILFARITGEGRKN